MAVALAGGALVSFAAEAPSAGQEPNTSEDASGATPTLTPGEQQVQAGRDLFVDGCSSCHGFDARGIPGRGPSLRGAGAAAADFYLRTGRMPLDDPEDEPIRGESPYTVEQREAIIAYIGELGGPGIPKVHPEKGDLGEGFRLFTEHCAGCHQIVGRGGITSMAVVPDLEPVEPIDVAEAIEVGPYVMPKFGDQLQQSDVDSIARYVEWIEDPEDAGGWGIGHIGPIPEGMVAWLLAGASLLLVIRLIGERTS